MLTKLSLLVLAVFLVGAAPVNADEVPTTLLAGRHVTLVRTAFEPVAVVPPGPAQRQPNVRARRLLWNGLLAIVQGYAETQTDCGQTKRIILAGGHENNRIPTLLGIPEEIKTRHSAGRCLWAGRGLTLLEFGVLHRSHPAFFATTVIGEAINLDLNSGVENR